MYKKLLAASILSLLISSLLGGSAFGVIEKSSLRRMSSETGSAAQAVWTSDSQNIYYVETSNHGGSWWIYKQKITSQKRKKIVADSYPIPSPDGKTLAVTHFPDEDEETEGICVDVYFLNLASLEVGDSMSELTGLNCIYIGQWINDGKSFLFSGGDVNSSDNFDVFRYDFETDELTQITEGFGVISSFSLSSDESEVAAFDYSLQKGVVINLTTGESADLPGCASGGFPTFVPNSSLLLCQRFSNPKGIFLTNRDGSEQSLLVEDKTAQQASVSPDGKYLIYTNQDKDLALNTVVLGAMQGALPDFEKEQANGVSIDNAALATRNTDVTLSIKAPEWATEILVSNDGGFGNAVTYTSSTEKINWQLDPDGPPTSTRIVYVRFGTDLTYTDSIILDTSAPKIYSVSTLSSVNAQGSKKISLRASYAEVGSGVQSVQYAENGTYSKYKTKKVSLSAFKGKQISKVVLTTSKSTRTLHVRFVEYASNKSKWTKVK